MVSQSDTPARYCWVLSILQAFEVLMYLLQNHSKFRNKLSLYIAKALCILNTLSSAKPFLDHSKLDLKYIGIVNLCIIRLVNPTTGIHETSR
jgi:hypothetical protein